MPEKNKEKKKKLKFPSKKEILGIFRGKGRLEEQILFELPFFVLMTKRKQKRIYDVINRDILGYLRAKREILKELYRKRKVSENISFGDLNSFLVRWKNINEKPRLSRSIFAGKDLLDENIGQEYEGGGYIGLKEREIALKELIQEGYVLEIPYSSLGIAEIGEKYYISKINNIKQFERVMDSIDVPGLGHLIAKMQAALKSYKKIEDPALRTYLTSGGHLKGYRD